MTAALPAAFWVGFLEGKKPIYHGAFSSDTCASVLGTAITEAERQFPAGELAPPPSVERVEILPDHREEGHAQLL